MTKEVITHLAVSPPETAEASAVSSHAATQLTNLKAPDTQDGAQELSRADASSGAATSEARLASAQKEIAALAATISALSPSPFDMKVVKVTYACPCEVILALPNDVTETEIDHIVNFIEMEHGLPCNQTPSIFLEVLDHETIDVDLTEANFVVTRDGEEWDFVEENAQ